MYAKVVLTTHCARPSFIGPLELADIYDQYQPIGEGFWILPLMVIFTNIINLYCNGVARYIGLLLMKVIIFKKLQYYL